MIYFHERVYNIAFVAQIPTLLLTLKGKIVFGFLSCLYYLRNLNILINNFTRFRETTVAFHVGLINMWSNYAHFYFLLFPFGTRNNAFFSRFMSRHTVSKLHSERLEIHFNNKWFSSDDDHGKLRNRPIA